MSNVYDYFEAKLGRAPTDETLRDLPADTPCGRDCIGVIDWTAEMLARVEHEDWRRDYAVEQCDRDCQIYWRG